MDLYASRERQPLMSPSPRWNSCSVLTSVPHVQSVLHFGTTIKLLHGIPADARNLSAPNGTTSDTSDHGSVDLDDEQRTSGTRSRESQWGLGLPDPCIRKATKREGLRVVSPSNSFVTQATTSANCRDGMADLHPPHMTPRCSKRSKKWRWQFGLPVDTTQR